MPALAERSAIRRRIAAVGAVVVALPGCSAPDTPPYPGISPSRSPIISPYPSPLPSVVPTPTRVPAAEFCPIPRHQDGSFDQNTGLHTLRASQRRQAIAVVSPERSAVQQLRFRLPNRPEMPWQMLSPGEDTGIVVRTNRNVEFDTRDNRAVWYRACEENEAAALAEVPSRVNDLFGNHPFDEVWIFTLGARGYEVQKVPKGHGYNIDDIPKEFIPYKK
jgi:hypothetical protein